MSRELMAEIDRRLKELEQRTANMPVRWGAAPPGAVPGFWARITARIKAPLLGGSGAYNQWAYSWAEAERIRFDADQDTPDNGAWQMKAGGRTSLNVVPAGSDDTEAYAYNSQEPFGTTGAVLTGGPVEVNAVVWLTPSPPKVGTAAELDPPPVKPAACYSFGATRWDYFGTFWAKITAATATAGLTQYAWLMQERSGYTFADAPGAVSSATFNEIRTGTAGAEIFAVNADEVSSPDAILPVGAIVLMHATGLMVSFHSGSASVSRVIEALATDPVADRQGDDEATLAAMGVQVLKKPVKITWTIKNPAGTPPGEGILPDAGLPWITYVPEGVFVSGAAEDWPASLVCLALVDGAGVGAVLLDAQVPFDKLYDTGALYTGTVPMVDPATMSVVQDPAFPGDPSKKALRYKKRNIRVNGYGELPGDGAYVFHALPSGVMPLIHGDELTAAPAVLPTPYPPTSGSAVRVGDVGGWIEVWEVDDPLNPGQRILRIFHLPPTVPATDQEFTTCTAEVTDGGNPAGGGAGSMAFEDVKVEPDATGHLFASTPEGTPSSLAAGAGLVLNGAGKAGTMKHANPGLTVASLSLGADPVDGGVVLSYGNLDLDALGHAKTVGENDTVKIIGDEWIDFSAADNEITVTHQVAQTDGALAIAGAVVEINDGSIGGGGDFSWKIFNPYIDSKGHINLGSSTSAQPKLTAGNRLKITGSGNNATIEYMNPAAGSPASIGDVMTGISFAIVGTNIVATITKKSLNVTTDSYGNVTAVTLGAGTDSTTNITGGAC